MKQQELHELCETLRSHQRYRVWLINSRNAEANRVRDLVARELGYNTELTKPEREKLMKEADKKIKEIQKIVKDEQFLELPDNAYANVVAGSCASRLSYLEKEKDYEKEMLQIAKQLPVAEWVQQENQKGFGILSLAKVIGEAGNLSDYDKPGKLWRRMGCAPYTKNGESHMGSTWVKLKKLSKDDWTEYGFSRRRRAVSFVIGENLLKQNKSIYRQRYDDAKQHAADTHPDWITCSKCTNGKTKTGVNCANCKGTGQVMMRCHIHAMLLSTKLLLKNLWIQWQELAPTEQLDDGGKGERPSETDCLSDLRRRHLFKHATG